MFNIGPVEFVAIGVIALLVFGPDRLPEIARNVAKFVGRFRQEAGRSIDELRRAAGVEDLEDEIRSIRGELTGARDEISGAVKHPMDELKEVARGGPTAEKRALRTADAPPPMDPEAT